MVKVLAAYILGLIFLSCDGVKSYKYTLFGRSEKKTGVQILAEDIIEARTDSMAYCHAFNLYWGEVRTAEESVKKYGSSSKTPIDFILLDDQGHNLRKTIVFEHKAEREAWVKSLHDSIILVRRPD